jgi:acyl transferase domain-containing protein/NAD(P)-dependent dehydrogenase (short-subunit alcohol dehydrogenase family)/acyl carrier protein
MSDPISQSLRPKIAIVGIGCRFPGGINSAADYWRALVEGRDTIGPMPAGRIDPALLTRPETFAIPPMGGYLDDIDHIDADFFSISPREAERLDPQQRLLLETAWEALENAGQDTSQLKGARGGVFVGQWLSDFEARLMSDPAGIDFQMTTGSGRYAASGRLSAFLGWRGPSITVDTACSSSLVAAHMAVRSIQAGECDIALVGAANVILQPHISIAYGRSGMLAADGRCKFGDASADGYVRSEGAAVLVLKSEEMALRDGNRIFAVVLGGAVNNDGGSSGSFGTPCRLGQEELLLTAMEDAGLKPDEVGYVEAHGTGTRAGDPVELTALGTIFGRGRLPQEPLLVGSAKTNIGHTESTAGLAGLIKAVLAVHNGTIPPSLNCATPNPDIAWDELGCRIVTTAVPWSDGKKRIAGCSAFGISGTNAHVLVSEHDEKRVASAAAPSSAKPCILPLSAQSPEALRALAGRYAELLQRPNGANLADICRNAARRRSAMEYRAAFVAEDAAAMADALSMYAAGEHARAEGRSPGRPVAPAFVAPGQGAQWLGMARALLESEPAFRAALERCDLASRPYLDWSIVDFIANPARYSANGFNERIDVVQPTLVSLSIAYAELLASVGVRPGALTGHSMGEVAAAYLAGVLDLESAMRVICRRSFLMNMARGQGAMALVELSLPEARRRIEPHKRLLGVAAHNGPKSCVLSGEPEALANVLRELEMEDIFCRLIKVDVASHSPQMAPSAARLEIDLAVLKPNRSKVPLYSTTLGRRVDGPELGASYWSANLTSPVLFAEAIEEMARDGASLFVELGPHPALLPSLQQSVPGAVTSVCGRKDEPDTKSFALLLATLWTNGCELDWAAIFPGPDVFVELPSYPWQRKRHWYEPAVRAVHGQPSNDGLINEVVSSSVDDGTYLAELRVSIARMPWLADHRVRGNIMVPAAFFIELACETTIRAFGTAGASIEHLVFEEALILQGDVERILQVALTGGSLGKRTLCISSRDAAGDDRKWTVHARGFTCGTATDSAPLKLALTADFNRGPAEHYDAARARGLEYGPAFQGITELHGRDDSVSARLSLPQSLSARGFVQHPAMLDAALQLGIALIDRGEPHDTWVPVRAEGIVASADSDGIATWACATRRPRTSDTDIVVVDIDMFTDDGRRLLQVARLAFKNLGSARAVGGAPTYVVEWRPAEALADAKGLHSAKIALPTWLVLATDVALAEAIATPLRVRGQAVVIAADGTQAAPEDILSYDIIVRVFSHSGAADPLVPSLNSCVKLLDSIHALTQKETERSPRFLAVTCGAQSVKRAEVPVLEQAPLWGVMRTLANEHEELKSRVIDLPSSPTTADLETLAMVLIERSEDQIAIRGGDVLLPRLLPIDFAAAELTTRPRLKPREGRAYQAVTTTPGILDGLVCAPLERRAPRAGEVEIEVEATGLNFLNVLSALGTYPGYERGVGPLGIECAGRIVAIGDGVTGLSVGAPVMAIALDCLASHVIADQRLVRIRPPELTAAEASALPIVFATAHYALIELGRLRRGERVLIHAAAGGVGLAALQIAKSVGADIYATAGTPEKRAMLSALGVIKVMDSRSLAFRDELLAATDGEGVDVVLNSLAGEFVPAGLDVLRSYGRFLEIGKQDIYRNAHIGLAPFQRNLAYFAIDLDRMIRDRADVVGNLLDAVIERLARGTYRPLPTRAVPVSLMSGAFRDMAQGRHVGKLVVTHNDPNLQLEDQAGRLHELIDGTCIITGGLGGLGLAVADWLVQQGAKRLVLAGRSPANETQQREVTRLRARGARVELVQVDVAVAEQVHDLVEQAGLLGSISAVFHLAGILDDATLTRQDSERFSRALKPKLEAAWHLHTALAGHPDATLVLFSSIAALLGLSGQANYAAANAGLDALALHRVAHGLRAISINWGPWAEIGMAAARADRGRRLEARGLASLAPAAALDALECVLKSASSQVAIADFDARAYTGTYPAAASSALLSDILSSRSPEISRDEKPRSMKAELLALKPGRPRIEALRGYVREQLGTVLQQPPSRLENDKPFRSLGLDSLMGLELRNRLEGGASLALPATLIWNYPTIATLADELARRLELPTTGDDLRVERGSSAADAQALLARAIGDSAAELDLEALLDDVERLSDDEARRSLVEGD